MLYHEKVAQVYEMIAPYIKKTPVLTSSYFSRKTNSTVYLKCENFQYTHSFKVRGAFSKIIKIPDKKHKIAIAASAGNHGLAVAFAAGKFGMRSIIVVPEFVSQFRIDMMRALGAEVILHGKTMDDLNAKIAEYTRDPSYVYVHPFDDDEVIAGQGTIAHELLSDIPDIDIIIASIGGGGLISGIAQYAKSFNPSILIYGTQTVGADSMYKSLQAGEVIAIPSVTSVAISLGATRVASRTFEIVRKNVEKVVAVSDQEAIHELKDILDKDKLLVEPASSCNLSALVAGNFPNIEGKKIAVIMCGGNFSLEQLKTYL